MGEAEKVESQVKSLTPSEFAKFREWFFEFDAQVWDRKLQTDSESGKLDARLADAHTDFKSGRTREI